MFEFWRGSLADSAYSFFSIIAADSAAENPSNRVWPFVMSGFECSAGLQRFLYRDIRGIETLAVAWPC